MQEVTSDTTFLYLVCLPVLCCAVSFSVPRSERKKQEKAAARQRQIDEEQQRQAEEAAKR